ncbi:uncharacterized protein LOC100371923 [Saccoglossus kowalevskii]|uniref:Arf-GAP domain and FG repeat-containing protein 1-like isoform X2 n=1 Tax=Saccoglossus kowalevskii TaxID=10224 RepID=A0ABM0MD79_SACKO|nr:PREDICTED: arf-GAP domain and FG repeat-containing protein 1-like isoform X2 [Saccoglossus kowalevskii]
MASKRKQDDKHLKMLREMVAREHNKKCFDCHQRGPTYVNMTIGSFVCTSCSGILRGLNPPNRVKSISMASYTPQEIEFLEQKGNEYCRRVWLGLYDARSQAEPESKDEHKVRDFMQQKYEKKRWYVSPAEAERLASVKQQTPPLQTKAGTATGVKPLKNLLGKDAPPLVVQNSFQASPVQLPPQTQQPVQKKTPSMDLLGDLGGDPFSAAPPQQQQQQPPPTGSQGGGGFADFGSAFGQTSNASSFGQQAPAPAFSQPTTTPGFNQSATANPFGEVTGPQMVLLTSHTVTTSSANQPIPAVSPPPSGSSLLQPNQPGQPHPSSSISNQNDFGNFSSAPIFTTTPAQLAQEKSAADRYAALSQLDTLFHDTGSNIDWKGGVSVFSAPQSSVTQSSSLTALSSSPSSSTGFGMSTSSTFGGSTNPFSQGGSTATGYGGQAAYGQYVTAGFGQQQQAPAGFGQQQQAPAGFGQQQQAPAGFGQQQQAPAGFGQTSTAGFGQQSTTGFGLSIAANPFMTQAPSSVYSQAQANGSFGASANMAYASQQTGGFGQMGGVPGGMAAQPAGFGTMGGFTPQQDLSFGGAAMTAMAGNQFKMAQQQQQQQQQQPQQFGGWNQQQMQQQQQQMNMAANPFMSAGQFPNAARPANTSNPFL